MLKSLATDLYLSSSTGKHIHRYINEIKQDYFTRLFSTSTNCQPPNANTHTRETTTVQLDEEEEINTNIVITEARTPLNYYFYSNEISARDQRIQAFRCDCSTLARTFCSNTAASVSKLNILLSACIFSSVSLKVLLSLPSHLKCCIGP